VTKYFFGVGGLNFCFVVLSTTGNTLIRGFALAVIRTANTLGVWSAKDAMSLNTFQGDTNDLLTTYPSFSFKHRKRGYIH
jgi:hypothetical protein